MLGGATLSQGRLKTGRFEPNRPHPAIPSLYRMIIRSGHSYIQGVAAGTRAKGSIAHLTAGAPYMYRRARILRIVQRDA